WLKRSLRGPGAVQIADGGNAHGGSGHIGPALQDLSQSETRAHRSKRAACLQRFVFVPDRIKPQLGRLIAVPMATIGALAAILVWELEHVGSILLAVLVLASVVV